ncbi:MAG: hypothetical protein A3F74_00145 [Betaproteobacteria bacterium RIFCSPLOWO2_12_FULL_62_58]|nr:MAG: hypothetical protein A3F74_00145 [Betaproteobacteria bacterium RIFCSPLOWO2_12_FULL_62_58]
MAGDIAGMVNNTFHDDATYYHNFHFFDSPPPYVLSGKENIIKAMSVIFERQGKMRVGEVLDWSESDNHIALQILVTSPNTGSWLITDFFGLRDGKVFEYFGYGRQLPLNLALP